MKRVILIVLDSVGMGELPDAAEYGDVGSNTLGNISLAVGGLKLPNLKRLGLGNIDGMLHLDKSDNPIGSFGRMAEASKGKDTTTGHWEMAGVILDKPFPLFPKGFPSEIIAQFEEKIGTKTLGNDAASGTEILRQLGEEHLRTGYPIVYTSADSVFQIAAHEDIIPIEKLYELCLIARNMLSGEFAVGRVIARPFEGGIGNFKRTERRKDYALRPHTTTLLEGMVDAGHQVMAVGKIEDIFCGAGITHSVHTHHNMAGVDQTLIYMQQDFEGLIFTNLVDFDMHYGHRNDVAGYAKALIDFDQRLPEILQAMKPEDILIITADHGCDPTTASTDHSREYVPLLVYGAGIKKGMNLGTRRTFCDIATTLEALFSLHTHFLGHSFLDDMKA